LRISKEARIKAFE